MDQAKKKTLAQKFNLNERAIEEIYKLWVKGYKNQGMDLEELIGRMKKEFDSHPYQKWCGTHGIKTSKYKENSNEN